MAAMGGWWLDFDLGNTTKMGIKPMALVA